MTESEDKKVGKDKRLDILKELLEMPLGTDLSSVADWAYNRESSLRKKLEMAKDEVLELHTIAAEGILGDKDVTLTQIRLRTNTILSILDAKGDL